MDCIIKVMHLWYEYRKWHQLHSPMPPIPINLDRNPGFCDKCISDHGGEMLIVPVHIWDFQHFTKVCCLLINVEPFSPRSHNVKRHALLEVMEYNFMLFLCKMSAPCSYLFWYRTQICKNSYIHNSHAKLTHCGLLAPYGDRDVGQH